MYSLIKRRQTEEHVALKKGGENARQWSWRESTGVLSLAEKSGLRAGS